MSSIRPAVAHPYRADAPPVATFFFLPDDGTRSDVGALQRATRPVVQAVDGLLQGVGLRTRGTPRGELRVYGNRVEVIDGVRHTFLLGALRVSLTSAGCLELRDATDGETVSLSPDQLGGPAALAGVHALLREHIARARPRLGGDPEPELARASGSGRVPRGA